MKKIMFFRPLYSLGGTEIAMLNLVKKLEGYELYIGYSDETSDKHLLDRFAEYANIVNLNEIEEIEVDAFITCSAHYNLVEAVKKVKAKKIFCNPCYIKSCCFEKSTVRVQFRMIKMNNVE